MADNIYINRIVKSLPLFLGGIFMIYLAAADDTVFDYVLDNTGQTRVTVAAATVLATAPVMFFAIGFIKQSILHEWEVIYQYQRLLEHSSFWIMAIVLLLGIAALSVMGEGLYLFNVHIIVGCVGFSAYLAIYGTMMKK